MQNVADDENVGSHGDNQKRRNDMNINDVFNNDGDGDGDDDNGNGGPRMGRPVECATQ